MDEEPFPVNFRFNGIEVHFHTKFSAEVVFHPKIVIACSEKHANTSLGCLGKFCKKTEIFFRNYRFVFKPIIEQITNDEYLFGVVLDKI